MAELKPCPFCGGKATFFETTETLKLKKGDIQLKVATVMCNGCIAGISRSNFKEDLKHSGEYRSKVVAAWNRRKSNGTHKDDT